jgi:SulP family sulfate permease
LVVDKLVQTKFQSNETTDQNKELFAQGVANASVAVFGGIPGAQATIRSVLILNEGATLRIAGVAVGIFVFVEIILFQGLISTIPQAVFSGILFKVGYDVFDWEPVIEAFSKTATNKPTASDWFFIGGTTIVTLIVDLNTAVILFCVLYYVKEKLIKQGPTETPDP